MALVQIFDEEWWPVLSIYKDKPLSCYDEPIELDDDLIKQYDETCEAFRKACDNIRNAQGPKRG